MMTGASTVRQFEDELASQGSDGMLPDEPAALHPQDEQNTEVVLPDSNVVELTIQEAAPVQEVKTPAPKPKHKQKPPAQPAQQKQQANDHARKRHNDRRSESITFYEHTLPGSEFFFPTRDQLTVAQFGEKIREMTEQHGSFLTANSYWTLIGRFMLLYNFIRAASMQGPAYMDEAVTRIHESLNKRFQSERLLALTDNDLELATYIHDLENFDWKFQETDSRIRYALCSKRLIDLEQIAVIRGGKYTAALSFYKSMNDYTALADQTNTDQ